MPVEIKECLNYTWKEDSQSGVLYDGIKIMLQFSNKASGESTDGIRPPLTWVPDLKDKFPLWGLPSPDGDFP